MFEKIFSTFVFRDAIDKKRIEALFNDYMAKIPETFYKNQFDLSKEIGGSYEDWYRILSHNAFASWKAEQIAIIAMTATDKALAGGEDMSDKNALPLLRARQDILKDEKKVEKPTIIVLPDTLFFKEEKE